MRATHISNLHLKLLQASGDILIKHERCVHIVAPRAA
jgi:hypothetical protein